MKPNIFFDIESEDLEVVAEVSTEEGGRPVVDKFRVYFRLQDVTDQFTLMELVRIEERIIDRYLEGREDRKSASKAIFGMLGGE